MSEFLEMKGRLAENKQQERLLRLQLDNVRETLRRELNPVEPHEKLNGELIHVMGMEYAKLQGDLIELLANNAAINRALGK